MGKIKLVDGTELNVTNVELVRGALKISTAELTVEELATMFSDKSNTNRIALLTDSGAECGYKTGFTSFAGINYDTEGVKTVELFQPVDITEARLSRAEAAANEVSEQVSSVSEETTMLIETLEMLMLDIIPNL